ncbi:MAG TPA: polyprenyl synthetase family protein [Nocardioidaceae bacterium]|jgi:heptaprenyl diphosphate synthase|nr:polyprenyl synthetase family protein [Nocardioidaceae bacterium]
MAPGPSSTALAMQVGDPDLQGRVRERLTLVEKQLAEAVVSDAPFVTEAARHLLDAGGKRFRPLLTVLAAEFGDPAADGVVPAALVVELTHLATLYHDDVMDEALLRRGAPSANARFDNSVAILVGDWLFAQASDIVAGLGPEAVHIQARTFSRLVQGQISETMGPGENDPLEHYLSVVADKTGSLIAAAARLGALVAGVGPGHRDVLTEYGEHIGAAFQLSDDVLDVASDSIESGKTPGTDLREGVPTLPVLLARRSTEPADARLQVLLAADLTDERLHAEALALLRAHPALAQARQHVLEQAERARDLLPGLPTGSPRDALDALCDVVVTRTS